MVVELAASSFGVVSGDLLCFGSINAVQRWVSQACGGAVSTVWTLARLARVAEPLSRVGGEDLVLPGDYRERLCEC